MWWCLAVPGVRAPRTSVFVGMFGFFDDVYRGGTGPFFDSRRRPSCSVMAVKMEAPCLLPRRLEFRLQKVRRDRLPDRLPDRCLGAAHKRVGLPVKFHIPKVPSTPVWSTTGRFRILARMFVNMRIVGADARSTRHGPGSSSCLGAFARFGSFQLAAALGHGERVGGQVARFPCAVSGLKLSRRMAWIRCRWRSSMVSMDFTSASPGLGKASRLIGSKADVEAVASGRSRRVEDLVVAGHSVGEGEEHHQAGVHGAQSALHAGADAHTPRCRIPISLWIRLRRCIWVPAGLGRERKRR